MAQKKPWKEPRLTVLTKAEAVARRDAIRARLERHVGEASATATNPGEEANPPFRRAESREKPE